MRSRPRTNPVDNLDTVIPLTTYDSGERLQTYALRAILGSVHVLGFLYGDKPALCWPCGVFYFGRVDATLVVAAEWIIHLTSGVADLQFNTQHLYILHVHL